MTAAAVTVSPDWLALREPADAAARSRDLVAQLVRPAPAAGGWVIHDLGGGTGSMGRWLAPLLSGPQHWVVHDRDSDLLRLAAADLPGPAADGAVVQVELRRSDITRLHPNELANASLITGSALLDMLTRDELCGVLAACAAAECPVLLTLSVVGRVTLTPADPLDARVAAAFNAHQRRATERGRLLGPGAAAVAVEEFARRGAEIHVRPSHWELGASHRELAAEWLRGWVDAACEQRPALTDQARVYTRRRLAQAAAGDLRVTVEHADLLVLPRRLAG
jgi:hypothetical protein